MAELILLQQAVGKEAAGTSQEQNYCQTNIVSVLKVAAQLRPPQVQIVCQLHLYWKDTTVIWNF